MQPADARTGNIYDLGYRNYDGPRLGRRHAILSLYLYTLRGAFGLGRRTSSKIFPMALAIIALLPAVVQLGLAGVFSGDAEIFQPKTYFAVIEVPIALFCAAVAPEITGRDVRHRTLALYFSRALRRRDYAFAKVGAFVSAISVLTVVPQVILILGNGLANEDVWGYVTDNWDDIPRALGAGLAIAISTAAVSLAIASQTPRRAYATIAVIAWFMVTYPVSGILVQGIGGVGHYAVFFSPFEFLHGCTLWIFNASPESGSPMDTAGFRQWVYPIVVLVYGAAGVALVVRRFDRIAA